MNPDDITDAKSPELRGSLAAMQRAAEMAREVAIQTNTAIIIVRDGKIVRVTAEELRQKRLLIPDESPHPCPLPCAGEGVLTSE